MSTKLNTKSSRKNIDESINEIINRIKSRTNFYSVFKSTYQVLHSSTKLVKKNFTENISLYKENHKKINIYRDYGLTRFSIYCDKKGTIQEVVDDLFNDGDTKFTPNSLELVTKSIIDFYKTPNINGQSSVRVGLTVLWILGKYKLIIQILNSITDKYEFYSLGFFHAAALAKMGTLNDCDKSITILQNLATTHDPAKYTYRNNYKMAIGASYIYYHIWEQNHICNFRNNLEPCIINIEENNYDKYYHLAVEYGEVAFKFLSVKNRYKKVEYRSNKYYYIVNNLIYYITNGGTDIDFKNIQSKVKILESIKKQEKIIGSIGLMIPFHFIIYEDLN